MRGGFWSTLVIGTVWLVIFLGMVGVGAMLRQGGGYWVPVTLGWALSILGVILGGTTAYTLVRMVWHQGRGAAWAKRDPAGFARVKEDWEKLRDENEGSD